MTEERLAELAALRAARLDPLDLPRTLTMRQVNAYVDETAVLDATIQALRTAAATLAQLAPQLAADVAWRTDLTAWRSKLVEELLQIKSPIRSRAVKNRADSLDFSIRLIDVGTGASTLGAIVTLEPTPIGQLMLSAGYTADLGPRGWRGATQDVERRIAELTKRRAAAQATLDALLQTDDERARREAEAQARREVLNTMHIRRDSDGTGLVAFKPDGDPLAITDMTEAQRAAFTTLS